MPWVKRIETGEVTEVFEKHWALDSELFEVVESSESKESEKPKPKKAKTKE